MATIGKIKELASYTEDKDLLKMVLELEEMDVKKIIDFCKRVPEKLSENETLKKNFNYLIRCYINNNNLEKLFYVKGFIKKLCYFSSEDIKLLVQIYFMNVCNELLLCENLYLSDNESKDIIDIIKLFLESSNSIRKIIITCLEEHAIYAGYLHSLILRIQLNPYFSEIIKRFENENEKVDYYELYKIFSSIVSNNGSYDLLYLYTNEYLITKLTVKQIASLIDYYRDTNLDLCRPYNLVEFTSILKSILDMDCLYKNIPKKEKWSRKYYLIIKIIFECDIDFSKIDLNNILDLVDLANPINEDLLLKELKDSHNSTVDIFNIGIMLNIINDNEHLIKLYNYDRIRKEYSLKAIKELIDSFGLRNKDKCEYFMSIMDSTEGCDLDDNFWNELIKKMNGDNIDVAEYLDSCASISDFINGLGNYSDTHSINMNSKLNLKK